MIQTPNGWRVWTLFGSTKNLKLGAGLKNAQNPTRHARALLGEGLLCTSANSWLIAQTAARTLLVLTPANSSWVG
jgi:hypothetical protein